MPKAIAEMPSAYTEGSPSKPLVLTSLDTPWIENADECFVVSDVTFDQLTSSSTMRRHASSWELIGALRNPSLDYGADVRVAVHARMMQPFLDLTLLFLALPLVLTGENRNIFVATGICLLVVSGFFVVILVSHALGTYGLAKPHFAAWCPLIIFVPLAFVLSKSLWE